MGKGKKKIEHKEDGERASLNDILKALNKVAGVLPASGSAELMIVKSKIDLQKGKLEKEIAHLNL